jgi:hypothetical protein
MESGERKKDMKLVHIGRIALGLLYLAASVFNLIVTLPRSISNPQFYTQWVANPLIPFYKTFFRDVVTPYAPFLTALVALYEITLGVLILSRGIAVKIGLLGGIFFNLLLAPMWIGQTFPNLLLAVLHVPLLWQDFKTPFVLGPIPDRGVDRRIISKPFK